MDGLNQPGVKALFGMSVRRIARVAAGLGQKAFRGTQLADALYRQRVESLPAITTLPAAVRDLLAGAGYAVGLPELAQTAKSVDGTERYLVRLADGETVETVWMPGGDGGAGSDDSEGRRATSARPSVFRARWAAR